MSYLNSDPVILENLSSSNYKIKYMKTFSIVAKGESVKKGLVSRDM